MNEDLRRHAPAAARNREPLLAVLREVLPRHGTLVELASGSGEHAVHFAAALPGLVYQPSDPDPDARRSIDAWARAAAHANLRSALTLDATSPPGEWPIPTAPNELDALLCINMIHIAPWSACLGLLDGAAHWLRAAAPLVLYGPYQRSGKHTAPSNAGFDESLRERNPSWGVRNLETVEQEANTRGLILERVVPMPANNLTVVLTRAVR